MAMAANLMNLTEAELVQLGLRILKDYYRSRLSTGNLQISSDVKGAGGIKADGFITYERRDGSWFTATLEASAVETRHEIRYIRRKAQLLLDTLVVSLWITAAAGAYNMVHPIVPMLVHGPLLPLVLLLSTFTGSFFLFKLLASGWQRYREIPALEQFKRYYADEQWVIAAEQVFQGHADPFYLELKRQCLLYGIGLILVNAEGNAHTQLSPSREYIPQQQARYRPFKQLLGIAAAFVLIGALWYREYERWRYRELSPKDYAEDVQQQVKKYPRDPDTYWLDTPFFRPEPYDRNAVSYLEEWAAELPNVVGLAESGGIIFSPCRQSEAPVYILEAGVFSSLSAVIERIEAYQLLGIASGALRRDCYQQLTGNYLFYVGEQYPTADAANTAKRQLSGVPDSLVVRSLKF
jgi:hypothetical protein